MPVTALCTAFFGSDAGRGWQENHHISLSTPVGDLLPVLQAYKTLMDNLRRPLLGKDRYLKGLRVSYPTPTGAIASSAYRYTPYLYPGNQREGCAPSVAAEARMGEATNQNFSNLYLRGFWDAVEHDEQLDFTSAAGVAWKALLDQFVAGLVGGQYGWNAQDDAAVVRGNVTNYTTSVGGFVTFTVAVTSATPLGATGTIVSLRCAKLNNSSSPLNRTTICRVDSPTTLTSVRQVAAGPFISAGTFVINATAFTKYTGMQYCILARKPEGRPTLQSRVRLKARARF